MRTSIRPSSTSSPSSSSPSPPSSRWVSPSSSSSRSSTAKDSSAARNRPAPRGILTIASEFKLYCQRSNYLAISFNAFLYGGFIGCFWYGEVIERKGRAYAVKESMGVMLLGVLVVWVSGSLTVLGIGFFLINFGFRGFANATINMLVEITSENLRLISPILLSIGWALGQIAVGLLSYISLNWKVIVVVYSGVPLLVLWYLSLSMVQSPRFLVCKKSFVECRQALACISRVNQRPLPEVYGIEEEEKIKSRKETYQLVVQAQIKTQTKHHSYLSIFKYPSVRIRTFVFSYIAAVISLSYFHSVNTKLIQSRSQIFNMCLAGAIEIAGCMVAGSFILNERRIETLRKILVYSGIVHLLFYFENPGRVQVGLIEHMLVFLGQIFIRFTTTFTNAFLLVYITQAFPTVIRHYQIGFINFVAKLAYALQPTLAAFWNSREIHPFFVNGFLLLLGTALLNKLRETSEQGLKDFMQEDQDGMGNDSLTVSLF